jgi:hypothetical protein
MMHQRRFTKEFEVEAVRQVQTAGEASVRSSHIGRTTARGTSFPFPLAPAEVGYQNGHRPFSLGCGNGPKCPKAVVRHAGDAP